MLNTRCSPACELDLKKGLLQLLQRRTRRTPLELVVHLLHLILERHMIHVPTRQERPRLATR